MELSPETCRIKPLRRINAIVASCWIYFTIKHDARNHKYSTSPIPPILQIIFFYYGPNSPRGPRPPHSRGFTIIPRHTTIVRTPLDGRSARRRDLYLTTLTTDRYPSPGGIQTHNLSRRAAADPRLRSRSQCASNSSTHTEEMTVPNVNGGVRTQVQRGVCSKSSPTDNSNGRGKGQGQDEEKITTFIW